MARPLAPLRASAPLRALVPLLVLGALLAACDAARLDRFEEEAVVSAVLVAGDTLPWVFLARTGPIDEVYDPAERALDGAAVTVSLLAADGSVEAAFPYTGYPGGLYYPSDENHLVQPERRYRLDVVAPGFALPLTAETTVPRAFEIVTAPPPLVVYQEGEPPAFDVTTSGVGEQPAVYVFTIQALDPSVEALTPFAAELVAERDVDLENLVETSSPLLNEANYTANADGSLRIDVPWFAFNFFGPNRVTLTALDEALVAFLEFQAIQFVPTTISPGEIPNVVTNVQNGVGVFGAAAQAEAELVVARP